MRRVLLDDFDGLARAGLEEIVSAGHLELLAVDGADVVDRLVATLPDVVVLDLDLASCDDLARRITTEFPALTVVACSARRPTMRVYPRFRHGESFDSPLQPDLLTTALTTT
ncbi:hypothetical protein ICW40_04000 [Actinotalea ferrariae]|uniref:hypothetical protein n=1 Tax=Actinotalea ferrariae TaxID=1386098 RepID=UPI001C8C2F39|nr:hypothetical protein [Actinotalea ferrariae]MBX9243969.1 hypothetical protein [Actinotalea ferrariae]